MKTTVLRATSFRALAPKLFETIIPLKLIEGLKAQYHFHQVPDVNNPSASFMFHLGELKKGGRAIEIEQLLVAYVGLDATSIGVAARSSTDDCDEVLENLLTWLKESYGLDTSLKHPIAYFSQIEFVLKQDFAKPFEQLRAIGAAISGILRAYETKLDADFGLSGFSMHVDMSKNPPPPIPVPFNIERRIGTPYEQNTYFSQAPLKTEDHKAVLEQFEKLLS